MLIITSQYWQQQFTFMSFRFPFKTVLLSWDCEQKNEVPFPYFLQLCLTQPTPHPFLSLQVLVVHWLSGLEWNRVSCTSVVALPHGLLPSGTPLLCHCLLLLVYWSVCDRWKSGSCQSKHQLSRTEASVLLRGVPEL